MKLVRALGQTDREKVNTYVIRQFRYFSSRYSSFYQTLQNSCNPQDILISIMT